MVFTTLLEHVKQLLVLCEKVHPRVDKEAVECDITPTDLCGLCLDAGVLGGGKGLELLQAKVKVRVDIRNIRAEESLNYK